MRRMRRFEPELQRIAELVVNFQEVVHSILT
jgi:hypothetical protein